MTRYFITAWCDRPFFAQCEVEADTAEEALARAREAIHEAPTEECDDNYCWDEWRVDTDETDGVLLHLDDRARLKATADNLLLACRLIVERWERGNLAEAARACRDAVNEATGVTPTGHRKPILIEARGSIVQEVRNVPSGVENEIVDHDDREEQLAPTDSPPLPSDPEGMNDTRASWAEEAVQAFQKVTGTDLEDALPDLLADLMHWADRKGYNFEAANIRARDHYSDETLEITETPATKGTHS